MQAQAFMQHKLKAVVDRISTVVLGKEKQVRDCVACLAAGGHLLIEDIPGVGKTTLAHALSRTMGLQFARVQFTSDLMPSDLLGLSIYNPKSSEFEFQPGPVFSNVLLADEINRASPKTQSALLEVMEERQVSGDGKTRPLPTPFFVIATQNPKEQIGTFPLPESQLDRFLMCLSLGYPVEEYEKSLLLMNGRRDDADRLQPVITPEELVAIQAAVIDVHAAPTLVRHLYAILNETRDPSNFVQGLSPRAGIGILKAAKAVALMSGRDYVAPDDIHDILVQTAAHRVVKRSGGESKGLDVAAMLMQIAKRAPL